MADATAPTLDADTLVEAADGTLAADRREAVARALAASSAQAGVARMLRDLGSESEALAADVARARRETSHRRHVREDRRVAAGRRFGGVARWSAALAACLVAVVGVWTQRHLQTAPRSGTHAIVRADEIFNSRDTIFAVGMDGKSVRNAPHAGDRLFRADFSGG
jgi:hypothetical protein